MKRMKRIRNSCLIRFLLYILAVLLIENLLFISRWIDHEQSPVMSNGTLTRGTNINPVRQLLPTLPAMTTQANRKAIKSATTTSLIKKLTTTTQQNQLPDSVDEDEERLRKFGEKYGPALNPSAARLKEEAYYSRRQSKVNPYIYDIVLKPNESCHSDTFAVILVHSHHYNTMQRTAIRNTWGSVASRSPENATWPRIPVMKHRFRLFFVLGTHQSPGLNRIVWIEANRFDDVVQGNFIDSYQNMTLKSLLGLKFVSEFCAGAKYLLKSDDDMFIHLPYLSDILTRGKHHRSIMGPLNIGSKVMRQGKWKLTNEEFPFVHFPPYESGAAYVISTDVVRELYDTAEYVPHIFIDDVYITGILGRILGIHHVRQSGFAHWSSAVPSVCDILKKRVITATRMTPFRLEGIWNEMRFKNC